MGRVLEQWWVFGGVCRDKGQGYMVAVDNKRSAARLLPLTQGHIAHGTIINIHSDCWVAYKGIVNLPVQSPYQYLDLVVNHSEDFVDPYSESSIYKLKFDIYNVYIYNCMWMQFENSSKLAFSSRSRVKYPLRYPNSTLLNGATTSFIIAQSRVHQTLVYWFRMSCTSTQQPKTDFCSIAANFSKIK